MRIEFIKALHLRSKLTRFLNIRGLFRNCLPTKKIQLWNRYNINSVGVVYYDPKHPAGYGSVANLVKAGKNNKNVEDDRQVKIGTLYINL